MKVISRRNTPARLPIVSTLTYLLALDFWNAPEWLWGAAIFIMLINWGVSIFSFSQEKEVDIFKSSDPEGSNPPLTRKSKFQERLEQAMNRSNHPH